MAELRPATGERVRLVNLVKHFGPVRAVDDVSLSVEAGEFLALLGPSGSGKTTILMSIAGFERPTSGEIHVGDRRIDQIPPHRRGIGMVFQRYALFPHLSVAENIAFPLAMRKIPRDQRGRLVGEALKLVRLEGYGARRTSQLSGGQQQRVALARALVYRPPVLLMDEPLGSLDRKLREELQLEVRELQQRVGATVIYVTHDQSEALTMADRIGVIHEGRLQQVGSPRELYDRPASTFVADFVGETNFLTGRVVDPGATCVVEVAAGHRVSIDTRSGALLPVGEEVRIAIRPERIRLSDSGTNYALPGTIDRVVYTGESIVYHLRLKDGTSVRARLAAHGTPSRQIGDPVYAAFGPSDAELFRQSHE